MSIGQTAEYQRAFTQADFDCYARISGDDNPIHVDPAFSARTKFGKTVAHGMLLYSTIGRCLGALIPGPNTVQISQELMFPNPTFVDQEIIVQMEVTGRPETTITELTTNIAQQNGKMGCVGKTLVWNPGAKVNYGQVPFDVPQYESEPQAHRGLEIGQMVQKTRMISPDDLGEFIDLVDEINPIYIDPDHARSLGFRDVLLPGGLLGGMVSDLLGTELPGRGANWLKQKYHFLNPAYPNDEITTTVEIIRIRPEKDLVNLRSTLTNQKDEIVVDGESLVWVSDLES
jgi:acyl dehydratase